MTHEQNLLTGLSGQAVSNRSLNELYKLLVIVEDFGEKTIPPRALSFRIVRNLAVKQDTVGGHSSAKLTAPQVHNAIANTEKQRVRVPVPSVVSNSLLGLS